MRCLVVQSTGNTFRLFTPEGKTIYGQIKGSFRLQNFDITNPIVVGDYVEVDETGEHWIRKILPRKNYIIRRSTKLSKQSHVLASNIDQMIVFVTLKHPTTSLVFVDRLLATAEAYRIPAVLLFNKIDMLSEEDNISLKEYIRMYEAMNYPCVAMATIQLQSDTRNYNFLKQLLAHKVTLLAGNSGVGKSTLVNAFLGDEVAKVNAISSSHDTGVHTTTFSQMYPIADEGWIIDTPGIKGFGMVEMEKEEIDHYFRDIFALSAHCRYTNCLHIDEQDCAVKQALLNQTLPPSRYDSYLSMLVECDQRKYREGNK